MVNHVEAQSQGVPARPGAHGRWRLLAIAALVAAGPPLWAGGLGGPPECAELRWVTVDRVAVNAGHVFCGEVRRGEPRGFHSTALEGSAARHLIVLPLRDRHPRGNGVYQARVGFRNGTDKFSTLFPDACEYHQVLRSIAHAFRHREGAHPVWGVYGPSAPEPGAVSYCVGADGTPLRLRLGLTRSGRGVNTAFPD